MVFLSHSFAYLTRPLHPVLPCPPPPLSYLSYSARDLFLCAHLLTMRFALILFFPCAVTAQWQMNAISTTCSLPSTAGCAQFGIGETVRFEDQGFLGYDPRTCTLRGGKWQSGIPVRKLLCHWQTPELPVDHSKYRQPRSVFPTAAGYATSLTMLRTDGLDRFVVKGTPTRSLTPTRSMSPTSTLSLTPTPSPTSSSSESPTSSQTLSDTTTPSISSAPAVPLGSPTQTPTPSAPPSLPTPSTTCSASQTASLTLGASGSNTASTSLSPSATGSGTGLVTATSGTSAFTSPSTHAQASTLPRLHPLVMPRLTFSASQVFRNLPVGLHLALSLVLCWDQLFCSQHYGCSFVEAP